MAVVVLSAAGAAGGMAVTMGPGAFLAMITGAEPAVDDPVTDATGTAEADAAPEKAVPGGAAELVKLEPMIVNITALTLTGRKTSRFLKLDLAVVVEPESDGAAVLADRNLFLRDAMQDYLRQLTEDDLQGSGGLALLKAELLRRARVVADSDAPREVLIADMVIQ